MSNIDKQALREAAEKHGDDDILALLDELEYYKSREERVTRLVMDNQTSWDELHKKLKIAEKLNAELNKRNAELVAKIEPMDRRIAELREWNAGLAQESCERQQRIIELEQKCENDPHIHEIIDLKERIAELEARAFNPAILDVIAERQRQKTVEGWTPEHDDEHCNGELAMAAVCYINETGTVNRNGGKPWGWPWDASWWKPNTRRRNLVKAGALVMAEIERIDRAAGIGKGE